jgi:hypothetical protein
MLFPVMRRAGARYGDEQFAALMSKIPSAAPESRELLLRAGRRRDVSKRNAGQF